MGPVKSLRHSKCLQGCHKSPVPKCQILSSVAVQGVSLEARSYSSEILCTEEVFPSKPMNLPKPHLPNYTHCGTAYVSRSFWACWFINGTRSLALDGVFWLWWKILESRWLSPTKSHETLDSISYSESWDPDPIISLGQGKTAFHVLHRRDRW